jgi:hypothetical protein
MLELNQNLSFF